MTLGDTIVGRELLPPICQHLLLQERQLLGGEVGAGFDPLMFWEPEGLDLGARGMAVTL